MTTSTGRPKRHYTPRAVRPIEDRFFEKVAFRGHTFDGTPCLDWTASTTRQGYGWIMLTSRPEVKQVAAHRWLYERWVGPIPDGLVIDHLCRVRHCVNPDHLEPVTREENIRRGLKVALYVPDEWCKKGLHRLDGDNVRMVSGKRQCIACRRAYMREYMRAERAQLRAESAAWAGITAVHFAP